MIKIKNDLMLKRAIMFSIENKQGDIFNSTCEALVNPVNCNGVAGKGLAFYFRLNFPDNFTYYKDICKSHKLFPGKVLLYYYENNKDNKKYIVNFPTKLNWWEPSKYEYIEKGMEDLIFNIVKYNISSIAIPALGCGLGSLSWETVRPIIIDKLVNSASSLLCLNKVELYLPG